MVACSVFQGRNILEGNVFHFCKPGQSAATIAVPNHIVGIERYLVCRLLVRNSWHVPWKLVRNAAFGKLPFILAGACEGESPRKPDGNSWLHARTLPRRLVGQIWLGRKACLLDMAGQTSGSTLQQCNSAFGRAFSRCRFLELSIPAPMWEQKLFPMLHTHGWCKR